MLVSTNPKPELFEFRKLMEATDQLLNRSAKENPEYYAKRGGSLLEDDVKDVLIECSKGTPFSGTIEKISGQKFPDIVAAKFYGVEVKSTTKNHWTSTGSSILETTRVADVERIYMTFGKLGGFPIEFRSRPYEECLCGIAVTHMPRYLIDMQLNPGETIFDKIGIPYDTLRNMKNPIGPVSKYYKGNLKPGQRLWWAGDSADEVVPATIRLWKTLSCEEKINYTIYGCANFPEIFGGKYDNYTLWLASQGIIDSHIRDQFSAGGQEEIKLSAGESIKLPAIYRRVKKNANLISQIIAEKSSMIIEEVPIRGEGLKKELLKWCHDVSNETSVKYIDSMNALSMIFFYESFEELSGSM